MASVYAQYLKKKKEDEEKKAQREQAEKSVTASASAKKTSVYAQYLKKKKENEKNVQKGKTQKTNGSPVRDTNTWFKGGAFEDGYQFGDLTATILGTAADLGINAVKGAGSLVEGVTDLLGYAGAGIADLVGADDFAQKWKQNVQRNTVNDIFGGTEKIVDQASVLGDKSDAIAQGIGQVGGIIATGGIGHAAGLSGMGLTALTTGVIGASGMGSGMSEAYNSGATDAEAITYGAITGTAEAVTEMLFSGLGKTVKAFGIGGKALSSADDMLAKSLSSKIQSQIGKNLVEWGVKAGAEGTEEVLSGIASIAGKKLTYMSEEEIGKIVADENLLEQFVTGVVTSGIAQSGIVPGMKSGSLIESNKTGRDFVTGLTESEQTEVNKEYVELLAEERKKGTVDKKQEGALYEEAEKRVTNAQYRANVSLGKAAMAHENFQAEFQGVLEQALQMPQNSEAYHLAVAAQKKIANGKQLSEAEVGALYRETAMEVVKAEGTTDAQSNTGVTENVGTASDESRRLTDVDMDDYLRTGDRLHVRDTKQRILDSGESPILTKPEEIVAFIRDAFQRKIQKVVKGYGRVNNRLASAVKTATKGEINIDDYYLELDADKIAHISDHIGQDKDTRNIPLTEEQLEQLPQYIDAYDDLINIIRRKDGSIRLMLGKKINGHSIILETVSKGRKSLHPVTAYQIDSADYMKYYKTRAIDRSSTSRPANADTVDISRPAIALNPNIAQPLETVNTEGGNQNGETTGNQPIGAANIAAGEGSTGGTDVSDGEQRGPAGTGAYEQAAPVAGATGQSQRADGRRAAFERENRNQAVRNSVRDAIPVSPRELGIPGGTSDTTIKIVPIAYQTEEMKNVSDWFEERGVRAYFFVGSMNIQQGGKDFIANGVLNGDYVFIKADSPNFDLEQIAEHEKFHLIKRGNPGLVEQLVHELQELPEADFSRIVDKYIKAYGSIVDMSRDGAELRIWNEILADAYAGMNARGVDVAAYQDEVVQRVQKYTGEGRQAQSNGVRQTNGPNSQTVENEGAEFAVASAIPRQTQNTGYDYSKTFAEQVEDFERGIIPKKDTLLVGPTPEVFRRIGLSALPMTINQTHIDYALHGTKDYDHFIGRDGLMQLPEALKHPVAIISSKTKNGTSLVAMLEIRQNGKQVIVPVVIDGFGVENGLRIDSHAITSVYGKDYSISKVLRNALEDEANGKKFSVYYVDIKKATGLLRGAKVLMPKMPATSPDGCINSITDPGSPVKPRFSGVTETQQFKRWFGDWQNYPNAASKVVNDDGTPRVVYHGTNADFNAFDIRKAKNGVFGKGFYFATSKGRASAYGSNKVLEVYLNVRTPYIVSDSMGFTSDDYLTMQKQFGVRDKITDQNVVKILQQQGYDGIIAEDGKGNVREIVAFKPTQIKSATNNVGTFDGTNDNIEFAIGSEPVDSGVDMEERMRRYENVPEYRPGMESSAAAEDPDVDRLLEWDRVTNDGSAKPDYEQNVPKSEFVGTPHMRELGIQIENSVGDYWGTAAAVANDRAAKQMKRQIKRAETQLNATEAEKDFAAGIASGKYYVEDIPGRLDEYVVRELAEYYAAEEALDTDLLREKKASISSGLFETMKELFRDSDAFTPSAALVQNYRTPERNMLKIFGAQRGKAINDAIFSAVAVNEAERYRFMNRMFDEVRTFEDSKGKKRELTKQERAMVMMHIEGKAASEIAAGMEMSGPINHAAENIAKGKDSSDEAREWGLGREERRLAEQVAVWIEVKEAMDSGKVDAKVVDEAAQKYSEMFNKFYDAINDFLVAHGYETIGFVRGYAPHIQPEQVRTTMNKAFHKMGIDADVGNLPASIAGMTADFKPNKRWNPHMQHRRTIKTQYDIAKAYESYVEYMSDIMYHTDDIMRVRQAANYFRRTYAPEEIKNMLEWAEELRKEKRPEQKAAFLRANGKLGNASSMSVKDIDEQFNEFVDEQYRQIENAGKYSELVKYLDNYANILAGKQSYRDRGSEANGRALMAAGNKLVQMFARSQVAGSISSALNQTAQLPQIIAEVGDVNVAHALWDMVTGKLRRAAWAQESDFLTGKKGVDFLVTEGGEKMISALFTPASFVDGTISTLAVRGEYLKQIKAGKSHAEAMKLADKKGTAIMGSRMKGSKPVAFHAKNFFDSIINVFQIEALNSWEHLSQDLPRDFHEIAETKGKRAAAGALANVLVKMILAAFIINRLDDELYGGTPAPVDVLGLTANFIASGEGLTTNQYLCTVFDNAWEKMTGDRPFDTDASELGGDFGWKNAVEDTVYNISNEIPFVRNISALMGAGDDTLPLPDVAGSVKDAYDAILDGKTEKLPEVAFGMVADMIPGGRQLEKTAQGLDVFFRGGKYSGYGDDAKLQYKVDQNAVNFIKAILFGRSGLGQSEFYASGGKSLTSAQTQAIEKLEAAGYDGMQIYDMMLKFRDLEPKEGEQKVTELQKCMEVAWSAWPEDMKAAVLETMMSESAYQMYESAHDAGVTTYEYFELMGSIDELEPENGNKEVSNLQKYMEVAMTPWPEQMKTATLEGMMPESSYQKYKEALDAGVTTYWYFKFLDDIQDLQSDKDKNGNTVNGSLKKKVVAVIDGMKLSPKQKDALFLTKYAESGLDEVPWN